jgi:hypothetical protein
LRLVEQEVLTFPEYLSSSPVFSDARSLAFCVVFIDNIACPSVLFLLVIVLFVLLRIMVSDYPFSIFKLSCVTEKQSRSYVRNCARVKPKTITFYFCFSTKHAALRRKNKDWVSRN